MTITLFLSGKKGLEVLLRLEPEYLLTISEVFVGVDKNILNDYSKKIASFCKTNTITYSLSTSRNTFSSKYAIAIGWRKLINYEGDQQLIIFHDSILPRLRGFNPLVTALINGDKEIGVTAILASSEYDRGDIIDVEKITIDYPIKIETAINKISGCYSILANRVISSINNKEFLSSKKQDEKLATYSLWRDDEDYFINWNESAHKIARQIDAVGFPYKGAKTVLDDKIITIIDSTPLNDVTIENRSVGKIIFKENNNPIVVCGKGLLLLIKATDSNNQVIDFSNKFRMRFK